MKGTTVCGICPISDHGFWKGERCPKCAGAPENNTPAVHTDEWVKRGTWEHIDPKQPNMRFNTKKELIAACKKRDLAPKALIKPKSQGKGWELK